MEILTAAQMRAIERAAIEGGQVTGQELMERAGKAVVEAIFEQWPELKTGERRAVILCGPGNNGGDGFVVALELLRLEWSVEVFLEGDAQRLPRDAKAFFDQLSRIHHVRPASWIVDEGDFYAVVEEPIDVFVDALFGIGLNRPIQSIVYGDPELGEDPSEEYESHFNEWRAVSTVSGIDQRQPRVVSIDIPSGFCADSGRGLDIVFRPDLCVTFHAPKRGHVLSDCATEISHLVVADIGLPRGHGPWVIPPEVRDTLPDEPFVTFPGAQIPVQYAAMKSNGHKFSHGHVLVLTGGFGKTGAARLAGQGALRIGAGLVSLGVPGAAQMEVATQITALMMQRIDNAADLEAALGDARISALCLGPGLGYARAKELVPVALASGRKICLDADALSAFADAPQMLFEMLHKDCVLTPHGGEFARLFPDIAGKLSVPAKTGPAYSKVDATREAAERAGCTVLFKGADTVISDPNGITRINASIRERAAPWLATAGSGDVLSGFITGLLARGWDPLSAAETAAYLHTDCALAFGPGLIAQDLPEVLPKVLAQLST